MCTTGFAWTDKSHPYIVSAGHCTYANGYVGSRDNSGTDNSVTVGFVDVDNYANDKGSVKLSGQN
ncbi:hypothetical protein ACFV2Z_29605 [Streptomyces sp. NPDC059688]|uniref:hypothetical protein n=1 Tax=Streptomyces sp. NPDC059688 TaxID=3346906 RepID=UPI0036C93CAA